MGRLSYKAPGFHTGKSRVHASSLSACLFAVNEVLEEEKLKNVFVLVISGVITVLKWTLEDDPLGHVSTVVSKYLPS